MGGASERARLFHFLALLRIRDASSRVTLWLRSAHARGHLEGKSFVKVGGGGGGEEIFRESGVVCQNKS